MSKRFVEIPPANLKEIYEDSSYSTPLIIILSAGSDTKADFDKLAEDQEVREVLSISLG